MFFGISRWFRNKKDDCSQKLRDKKALDYSHICHILKLKSLNSMLKYKVFFTTPLLICDKKYCLQVYYDNAILPPHYFVFLISFFSVYNMLIDW